MLLSYLGWPALCTLSEIFIRNECGSVILDAVIASPSASLPIGKSA